MQKLIRSCTHANLHQCADNSIIIITVIIIIQVVVLGLKAYNVIQIAVLMYKVIIHCYYSWQANSNGGLGMYLSGLRIIFIMPPSIDHFR